MTNEQTGSQFPTFKPFTDQEYRMIELRSSLKAQLTQTAIAHILVHGGYRVTPLGVETRCPDVVYLNRLQYQALQLPPALRSAPDLAAYLLPSGPLSEIEVKYTASWTAPIISRMYVKLVRQQAVYARTFTVILRGKSPETESPGIDDLVRVLPPGQLYVVAEALQVASGNTRFQHSCGPVADPRLEPLWQQMLPMRVVFPGIAATSGWQDSLIRVLQALAIP